MNFKDRSFRTRSLTLCIFLTGITVLLGGLSYRSLTQVGFHYNDVTDRVAPNLEYTHQMSDYFRAIRISLRSLGIPGLNQSQKEAFAQNAQNEIKAYEDIFQKYMNIPFVPGEQEVVDELQASWLVFKELGQRILALNKEGTPESYQKLIAIFLTDCPAAALRYEAANLKFKNFHFENSVASTLLAKDASHRGSVTIALLVILGSIFALVAGIWFSNTITLSLTAVAEKLSLNASQVSRASGQIAASSQSLGQAALSQAASLEETASALEEIGAMVAKTTDNARKSATCSEDSQNRAEEGKSVVGQMLDSMQTIHESNQQMGEIVKVIQEIGSKTKVINDIVFQTKLLSFNASVEAARAGVHGKGFSVVAEEVGKLAQMSGNAAIEISLLLDASTHKVQALVESTKTKVDQGVEIAKQCSEVLSGIVTNVSEVAGLAQSISTACDEQTRGITEINKAMTQLDTANTESNQEIASAAEELSSQSESLKGTAVDLMGVIYGNENKLSTRQNKALSSEPTSPAKAELQRAA